MSEAAAVVEGATAPQQQPISSTPDMSAQVADAAVVAPVAAAADSAAILPPVVAPDAAASTPAAPPATAAPASSAPASSTPASSSPAKPAAAPGFAPLPSDAVLRSSIRTLLGASDLTRLTPKLVRAHLTKLLSLGPESEARLKKQVQPILAEEIERVHAAADKALAKEAADKAAKEKASGKTGRSPTASPSKNKKQKKSSSAEGEEDEEAGPAKKQKTGKGSSAVAVPSVGEDEIERMAAEAEADEDGDGSEAPEQPAAAAAASKSEDADALMAQELANSERRPRRAAAKPASVKKVSAPRKKKEVDPNAPAKPKKMAAISEALQAFFDYKYGAEMNRGEVVKLLWVYIKEHKCQDPKDGRRIILDDKLKTIFGEHRKFVQMMGMNKDLQKHIKNKDQLTG